MPKRVASELMSDLQIEMARLNMAYSGFTVPPGSMAMWRVVPITNDLSEYVFLTTTQQVLNAAIVVREILRTKMGPG
jgi:hypothetical protein